MLIVTGNLLERFLPLPLLLSIHTLAHSIERDEMSTKVIHNNKQTALQGLHCLHRPPVNYTHCCKLDELCGENDLIPLLFMESACPSMSPCNIVMLFEQKSIIPVNYLTRSGKWDMLEILSPELSIVWQANIVAEGAGIGLLGSLVSISPHREAGKTC